MGAKVKVNQNLLKQLKQLPETIRKGVAKKVQLSIAPTIEDFYRRELPDGDAPGPDGRSNRSKQSAKVKARFPGKLRNSVTSKIVEDAFGTLLITGVDSAGGGHQNFDFGEKAKLEGRTMIFWGKDAGRTRQQTIDIPAKAALLFQSTVESQLAAALDREVKKAQQSIVSGDVRV